MSKILRRLFGYKNKARSDSIETMTSVARGSRQVGAFSRAKGWTPEIVEQAATETGLNVSVGSPGAGNDPTEWLGLWSQGGQDLGPFWDRAKELRQVNPAS